MKSSFLNEIYLGASRVLSNSKPITILRYHSISKTSDPYTISPEKFELQAEFISRNYNIARLSKLRDGLLLNNHSVNRTVIFTFDDAYCDFLDVAYPILERRSIWSTLFIPSGLIGKANTWDSEVLNYVRRPILSSGQLIQLKKRGLVDFGSHSVSHESMDSLSLTEMKRQVVESKDVLEDILDCPITMFSYPYGHFSKATKKVLLDAHYDMAVTSKWGTLSTHSMLMNLRRIYLTENDTESSIEAKINGMQDMYHLRGFRHIEKLGLRL